MKKFQGFCDEVEVSTYFEGGGVTHIVAVLLPHSTSVNVENNNLMKV